MRFLYLLVSLFVVLFDQWTKALVVSRVSLGESIPVVRNFLHLTHTQNPGIAFGLFGLQRGPYQNLVLIGLSVTALVVVAFLARRYPSNRMGMQTAFALIIGGAAGNLWDRIVFGQVTDFVDVFYHDYHWPVFNVADSAISVGVTLLAIGLIFFDRPMEAPPSSESR
jgi:signal peptidase II